MVSVVYRKGPWLMNTFDSRGLTMHQSHSSKEGCGHRLHRFPVGGSEQYWFWQRGLCIGLQTGTLENQTQMIQHIDEGLKAVKCGQCFVILKAGINITLIKVIHYLTLLLTSKEYTNILSLNPHSSPLR